MPSVEGLTLAANPQSDYLKYFLISDVYVDSCGTTYRAYHEVLFELSDESIISISHRTPAWGRRENSTPSESWAHFDPNKADQEPLATGEVTPPHAAAA